MAAHAIYQTQFPSLGDTDTVSQAIRQMLDHHVSDLPVIEASGRFMGMFRLRDLLGVLLPKAATVGGMPDLAFVSDTIDDLRERVRDIGGQPVRNYMCSPEHVVRQDGSPLEMVLLLYKGANAVPVVSDDGRLVGMVTARDVLAALRTDGVK